jgi:hypothetical protein
MPRTGLTGSRLRARRLDLGLRQGDLAQSLGISASYLNLIEHNRRRIAGKLLTEAARALDTDVSSLTQGAEAAQLDGLRDAAAQAPGTPPDLSRAEEFARRFPDWADLTIAQGRRIAALERAVETLNDRMSHDPFLSQSLHDVLSTVTAIRSTSAILADDGPIDPEWQARFHRNLFEDSQRLADSAQGLVGYLDGADQPDANLASPQEEVEAWLVAQGHHLHGLEDGQGDPEHVVPDGASGVARVLMLAFARRYSADARVIPLAALRAHIARNGADPGHLAQAFDTDLHLVFRRLASLPEGVNGRPVGLVVCDGSGTLTHRKALDGFPLPRFGAACPLWPLYLALSRPHAPIRQVVQQAGQMTPRFTVYAQSIQHQTGGFDGPTVTSAAMLILPEDGTGAGLPIGTSCRICPRPACAARREPAIVASLA